MSMVGNRGFQCDVCGKMIILIPGQALQPITIVGIDRLLHVHNPSREHDCREKLVFAMQQKNWRLLPYGPLKEMYFKAINEERAKGNGGF